MTFFVFSVFPAPDSPLEEERAQADLKKAELTYSQITTDTINGVGTRIGRK